MGIAWHPPQVSRKTKWTGWLDLRPGEARSVGIALASAFLLLAALTLARSLREAMYLGRFAVETLPYVTAAAVAINFQGNGVLLRHGLAPSLSVIAREVLYSHFE